MYAQMTFQKEMRHGRSPLLLSYRPAVLGHSWVEVSSSLGQTLEVPPVICFCLMLCHSLLLVVYIFLPFLFVVVHSHLCTPVVSCSHLFPCCLTLMYPCCELFKLVPLLFVVHSHLCTPVVSCSHLFSCCELFTLVPLL